MRRKCRPIPHSQRRASENRIQLRDSLEKAELWGHKKVPRLLRAEEKGKGVAELTFEEAELLCVELQSHTCPSNL